MFRVVNQIIIQGYLKHADVVHVFFFKNNGPVSLINSLIEKNSHENYNVKKGHVQIAQLRVKHVEPHIDQMLRL